MWTNTWRAYTSGEIVLANQNMKTVPFCVQNTWDGVFVQPSSKTSAIILTTGKLLCAVANLRYRVVKVVSLISLSWNRCVEMWLPVPSKMRPKNILVCCFSLVEWLNISSHSIHSLYNDIRWKAVNVDKIAYPRGPLPVFKNDHREEFFLIRSHSDSWRLTDFARRSTVWSGTYLENERSDQCSFLNVKYSRVLSSKREQLCTSINALETSLCAAFESRGGQISTCVDVWAVAQDSVWKYTVSFW